MNEGKRLLSIFIAPAQLFEDLEERPRWWLPYLILILVAAVATVLPRLFISPNIWIEAMGQDIPEGMNAEQLIMLIRSPVVLISGAVLMIIGQSIVTFFSSLLLWALFVFFGKESTYKKSLALVSYSALIRAFGILLLIGLAIAFQRLNITASLAFLPFLERGSFLYFFTSKIDFFALWRILIAGAGFAVVSNTRKSTSYIIAIILWLLLSLGFAAVPLPFGAVLFW